ncbi:MAG TPA: adenylate/guanylate cyclase domain-containing protein [Burkholderiales bacterium]|nr:adenylate/guanylate cyclase domain-containing protein [Burkholderiales bacterium]
MSSERLERKLAAIFYADVAGYSRLTGQDEEGTHRILSACLDSLTAAIKRHGGKVLHYAGDAVLADFPSVVDALSCGVDAQHDLNELNAPQAEDRRLQFRIGINLGDVIVDRGEIYGDGVNVAARLESLADPGGICISGTVYDAVGNKLPLAYEFMGQQSVKNIARPVRAYRVLFAPASASAKEALFAATGELRQIAVMSVGISDFARLGGEVEPEEAHGLLNRFTEIVGRVVESYGGFVDKHMGDTAIAVFGVPRAHDNDPERAVRAALEVHQDASNLVETGPPLQLQIGLACGRAMVSGAGGQQPSYTFAGGPVILAARLQELAAPGETLIADAVYRTVSGRVACEPRGDVALRGFARPARVWRVSAMRGDPTVRHAFVGRHAELAQLTGALRACTETGGGQTILVRGEAGIGKTRLVEELAATAAREGFVVHRGIVLDFGAGAAQGPVRMLVRSLLGLAHAGTSAERQSAAERAVAEGMLPSDRRPFLYDLLDVPQTREIRALYDAMDNDTRNRGKREVVTALIRAATARAPIVLAVEDIHWAEPVTLSHLAAITSALTEIPAVLVMTSRVEGDPLDQAWRSSVRGSPLLTIDLPPLRRDEAIALASKFADVTKAFAMQCVERAEGNPLFLEHLLRNAEEGASDAVPATIQSLVLARIDRLAAQDKTALQAASAVGQRFALDALRCLVDDADYDPQPLVRSYLVQETDEGYLFAHALIREGVYASLPKTRRRELHRRLGGWFADRDPILRAQHLDRAEDEAAPGAYLNAARTQAADYRYERALQLAERGLALARTPAEQFWLTCAQGELLRDLGSVAESIEAYRKALELASDDQQRCRARIGLAAGMRVQDQYDDALAALEPAEAAATKQGLVRDLAQIHCLRGNLCFPLGRIEQCREQHKLALKYALEARSPEEEAQAVGGLGDAEFARGRVITAYEYFRRCVALCREHGFGRIEVANRSMLGHTRLYFDGPTSALEDALASIEAARRVGHLRAEMNAGHCAIFALVDMDELDRADEQIEQTRAVTRRLGARNFEATALAFTARVLAARGQRAEALDALQQAAAISRETGITFTGPRLLGFLALTVDDPAARRQALEEGQRVLDQGCVGHNYFWFYRDAMDVRLKLGDWGGVERYASALEAYTRPEPLPWTDFFIARGRALAAFGAGRRGEGTAEALARARDEGRRLRLMAALGTLEQALASLGGS